jgi:epoxyqueuosine reductase QueG
MSLNAEIAEFIEIKAAEADQEGFYRKPLVGFSSAADPLYAAIKEIVGPHHLRPEEVLPGVKTLVSYFLPFSKKVVEANRKEPGIPAREWVDSYAHANNLINAIGRALTARLEAKGIRAGMVDSTNNYTEITLKAPWSHRSAAFVAGLGRFGLNRMLITKVGGAGRYGTIFIAEELQPTARSEEEPCLFFKNGGCRYCLKHCPAGALGGGPDEFDRQVCNKKMLNVSPYARSLNWNLDVCGKCDVGPCAIF